MASDTLRFLDTEGINIPHPINVTCILDKERSIRQYINYMLDRTNQMFEYENLPKTIPAYMLELYLQIFGYAAFVHVDDVAPILYPSKITTPSDVYIFFGGIGGERDIYYRPKIFTLANPRLKNSVNCTILYDTHDAEEAENPCVLMKNDTNYEGLLPLFNRYAAELVENDISIRCAQINSRAQVGVEATNDRDKETARKYFDDLEAGKIGVIGETPFLDGIRFSNMSTQSPNTVIQLIELHQYLKASWYNELGLNVNFNMKREYMSEEEIAVNTDILLPLVDDMLRCREEACELINKVFGTNISVKKSSAWANKEQEELAALSEASIEGGIGLKQTIADKIEGGTLDGSSVDKTKENVQSEVPPQSGEAEPEAHGGPDISDKDAGGDGAERGAENDDGDVAPVAADVTVEVEVQVKGGESVESDDVQPEASEKPEESDAE